MLIGRDQTWEIPLVENPAIVEVDGATTSSTRPNRWNSHEYAVGYAVCDTVTGPCRKPEEQPILTFTPEVMGPGGQMLVEGPDGQPWIVYHAWTGPDVGYPIGMRSLRIDRIDSATAAPSSTDRRPIPDPPPPQESQQ